MTTKGKLIMKRVFLHSYQSSKSIQNGKVRFDVYFNDSDGANYVWTPDWTKETRQFFMEASRLADLGRPQSPKKQRSKVAVAHTKVAVAHVPSEEEGKRGLIDFERLAFGLGEICKSITTLNRINEVASATFDFKAVEHSNPRITQIHSQAIYDWIKTLDEQPLGREMKLKLLREFVGALQKR